jgi:hypothetical protein
MASGLEYYFNLRTAVLHLVFIRSCAFKDEKIKKKYKHVWFLVQKWMYSTAVVCLAEGGQFFILNRHPDAMDVLFGIVGNQMGFVVFQLF